MYYKKQKKPHSKMKKSKSKIPYWHKVREIENIDIIRNEYECNKVLVEWSKLSKELERKEWAHEDKVKKSPYYIISLEAEKDMREIIFLKDKVKFLDSLYDEFKSLESYIINNYTEGWDYASKYLLGAPPSQIQLPKPLKNALIESDFEINERLKNIKIYGRAMNESISREQTFIFNKMIVFALERIIPEMSDKIKRDLYLAVYSKAYNKMKENLEYLKRSRLLGPFEGATAFPGGALFTHSGMPKF